jgi:hypothetical protein
MKRLITPNLARMIACFLIAPSAFAATHYIAANGSDSNNGSTTSTSWRHAPGMPNCTNNCASYTPVAGDRFILRGGDTYHVSAVISTAVDTPMGGTWNWTWSGSSTSCDYPAATSSCIYLGVDQTWYAGASWVRPVFSFDNPLWANSTHQDSSHNGFVNACSYDDYNTRALYLSASYVQVDNIEFSGKCWTQPPTYNSCSEVSRNGTYLAATNLYVHGWTETYNPQPNGSGAPMDVCTILSGNSSPAVTHNVIAYSVFSGNDTICTGYGACTGGAVAYPDAYDFHDNVVEYISNGLGPTNPYTVHDNLFRYIYESYDPAAHGSVFEALAPTVVPAGTPFYFYNNIVHDSNIGETIETVNSSTGGATYFFNNVMYNIGNPSNCIYVEQTSGSGDTATTFYFYNNTIDTSTGCVMRISGGTGGAQDPFYGTMYFQNDHLIGVPGSVLSGFYNSGSTAHSIVDNGHEILQSESAANGQGYSASDSYAPTSSTGATVGAGADLAGSCALFSPDSSLCSGIGGIQYNTTNHTVAAATAPTRPSSGAWDAGAYFLSGPNPPTGLQAITQ